MNKLIILPVLIFLFSSYNTPGKKENIEKVNVLSFNEASCKFPSELVIHPPKQEGSYELGVQNTRFFPIGMSNKGVFAYFSFRGEMDSCECVQSNLILFSTEQDTVLNSFLFSTNTENGPLDGWEEFTDPKKIWETEQEMYCSILEDEKIVSTEYDVIDGEDLMTIFQLVSSPTDNESMSPTIRYTIYDEESEVIAESSKNTQIISAELVAMLRYKIGNDYFFVKVIGTKEAGYEGATLREYDIH